MENGLTENAGPEFDGHEIDGHENIICAKVHFLLDTVFIKKISVRHFRSSLSRHHMDLYST